MKHVQTPTRKQRIGAVIAAGALAMSTMGAPLTALAANPVSASAGVQTGTGLTDVTVQLPQASQELGGSNDPANPPIENDPQKLGENISFTVPTSINFVAKPNGELVGPSPELTYIENESVFSIYASSMQVDVDNGWNLVRSVGDDSSDKKNIFDFTFGPASDQLNAVDYTSKAKVHDASKWEMTYAVPATSDHPSDRVELDVSGNIGRVENDITKPKKLATLHTYVTQGKASAGSSEPEGPSQP